MDGELVSIECHDEFDPKIVRLLIRSPDGQIYSFDIPEAFYAMISGPLGFPPNPCA